MLSLVYRSSVVHVFDVTKENMSLMKDNYEILAIDSAFLTHSYQ